MMNAVKAGAARHDEHDDATNTTKTTFMNVVSSSRRGRRVSRRLAVGLFAVAAVAGGAACTTKAAAPIERPALEVPPPPPRVVVPLPDPPAQIEPVETLGPGAVPAPARPRPPRDKNAQKPGAKPEDPKPTEPAAPAAQPPPQLRMPETVDSAQLANQIKDAIARARAMLARVDYQRLGNVAKKAYDESKLFAQQAEDALKTSNLALAKELADKAERLAKELQGR